MPLGPGGGARYIILMEMLDPTAGRFPAALAALAAGAALAIAFTDNPKARGYVLDDRGAVRKHLVIFVDGAQIEDRQKQSDSVHAHSEIFIMQSLSGG